MDNGTLLMLARLGLQATGGALVGKGYLEASMADAIAGASLNVLGAWLSQRARQKALATQPPSTGGFNG